MALLGSCGPSGTAHYDPILLLAIVGALWLWRRARRETALLLACIGAQVVLYSTWSNWSGGYSYPASRQLNADSPYGVRRQRETGPVLSLRLTCIETVPWRFPDGCPPRLAGVAPLVAAPRGGHSRPRLRHLSAPQDACTWLPGLRAPSPH